jgi:hypothetical protein
MGCMELETISHPVSEESKNKLAHETFIVSKQTRPNVNTYIRPVVLAFPRNLAFYRTLDRLLNSQGSIYRHNACIICCCRGGVKRL